MTLFLDSFHYSHASMFLSLNLSFQSSIVSGSGYLNFAAVFV